MDKNKRGKPQFSGEKSGTTLKDSCVLIMGQSPSSNSYNTSGDGLPFYQGNADFGEENPVPRSWCTEPKKIAEKGDILISVRAPIGAINIADEKCCIGRGVAAIRPNQEVMSPDFLQHQLFASRNKLEAMGTGSTFKAIGKKTLSDFPVVIYPKNTQEAIAQQLNSIKKQIKTANSQLDQLDALVKSRFIEMFGDPIRNEKGLPFATVEELAAHSKHSMKAGPFGSSLKKSCYVEAGYKIYGQEQVISGDENYGDYYIDSDKYQELCSCHVEPGDVLISLVGTVGKVLVLSQNCQEGIINPRLVKITFDRLKMEPDFFSVLFTLESVRDTLLDGAHGQTMSVLNLGMIKKLRVAAPPIEQQRDYLAFVQQVDKSRFKTQQQIEKLEMLKKSLMQEYFG